MERVMIIGCCGAGKSTLARALHKIVGMPQYHLDQYYWKENWIETPEELWPPIVKELAAKDQWIIYGNYGGTMDIRIERADKVVFLDYSTSKCLYRVLGRIWKYHGQVRPDMPKGCRERFDFEFIHYVATFNMIRRKSLLAKCEAFSKHGRVVILKSDKEVNAFLESVKK